MRRQPNQVFVIHEPQPGDTRPRNAFGTVIGFGKAYNDYYDAQDRERGIPPVAEKDTYICARCETRQPFGIHSPCVPTEAWTRHLEEASAAI